MLKAGDDWLQKGQNTYLVSYTVAMQPLVLSVTMVSGWSRSDGYTRMHVCTYRHTHFHIFAVTVLASLQNRHTITDLLIHSNFCIQITFSFFPFSFFQAQQERSEGSQACQTRP